MSDTEPVPLTHGYMVPLDPPGTTNRRWTCKHCGAIAASMSALARTTCTNQQSISDGDLLSLLSAGNKP